MPDNDETGGEQRLKGRAEIEELKARYARGADAVFGTPGPASAQALADLFTDDGVLDLGPFGRYEGRAALLNAFQNILPLGTKWSTHYIMSPILDVGAHTATGRWYFLIKAVPQSPPGAPVIEILGEYTDKYKRTEGGWKIRETLTTYFAPPT